MWTSTNVATHPTTTVYSGDTSEIKDLQDKPTVASADSGAHNKVKPEAVKANKFKRTLKPFLL